MKYTKINPTYIEVKVSDYVGIWETKRPMKYWEYRDKWHKNPEKQIVGNFPLHLDIESTRKCNLRCPMCPRTIKLNRGEKIEEDDMDFGLFKKIIDEGVANGLYAIKLSYLGEPLICKDIVKMVAYAKSKGIVDIMFNTNGVLLTKNMSKKLIKAGLDKIFISFDSPFKERYEKIRVGAKFEKTIENVKNLIEIRTKLNSPTPIVRISMVTMKENKDEVLDYIKLWKPIVDLIGFCDYINPQGMDKEKRYAIKLKQNKNFVCSQLYQRLIVQYNGNVGLCCVDYDAECNLGNAKKDSIKDIWKGKEMQKIRKLHNDGKWDKVPLCAKCHMPYA